MSIPVQPPDFDSLLKAIHPSRLAELTALASKTRLSPDYLHWDKLRELPLPAIFGSHEEWWLVLKQNRRAQFQAIPLQDARGNSFRFVVTNFMQMQLRGFDFQPPGDLSLPLPQQRPSLDRQIVSTLMEEAITSSQLAGAVTTRGIALDMLRSGRPARDRSEQMIANNYAAMRFLRENWDAALTPELVFELHRLVTHATLDNPEAAGRLRLPGEQVDLGDAYGNSIYTPPPSEQLPGRLQALCDFAHASSSEPFVHPILRSIMLHFWLAYDHPFTDGNGRIARALFYWSVLRHKYWIFECMSISSILKSAPTQYACSYLHTETDDNDLTYFLTDQLNVCARAMDEFSASMNRKSAEYETVRKRLTTLDQFNPRQAALLLHALKHPDQVYTIAGHQASHAIVYQTARTDLQSLAGKGLLQEGRRGRAMIFTVPPDLSKRLEGLQSDREADLN